MPLTPFYRSIIDIHVIAMLCFRQSAVVKQNISTPYWSHSLIPDEGHWTDRCKAINLRTIPTFLKNIPVTTRRGWLIFGVPLFVDAHILPLKFVYYESIANLMFDVQNKIAPSNIQDLFQDISNVHYYNTRSSASNNFYTKSSRLYPFKRIPSLE